MFAKLYGPDDDQILVTLGRDQDGDPCVKIQIEMSIEPRGSGIATFFMVFYDTDEGHAEASATFNGMTEAAARELVADLSSAYLPKSPNLLN